jgi:hypothetical protein
VLRRARKGLTYANVVATLALFLALGGASYAALTLPRDSVGRSQLRNGSVTLPKLAFPLAMATGSNPGPVRIGMVLAECAVSVRVCLERPPIPTVLTTATLDLARPSDVLLLGSATFYEPGVTSGESDTFSLGSEPRVLGGEEHTGELNVEDGFRAGASLQRLAWSAAGRHTFFLTASGYTSGSRTADAYDAELVAIVLPSS